mgnify:CR=1 FL=1
MEKPIIEIEYCSKCRWLPRSVWIAQELLSTFNDDIKGITLFPGVTAGIFKIRCGNKTIWSRGKMKGFPEIKNLKQIIRDKVAPDKELGHIDK